MDTSEDKKVLRKALIVQRLNLPDRLHRVHLLQGVMRFWLMERPDAVIGAYWPIKGEFDPLPALHRWKEDGELLGGITWGTYNGAHCTCTIALAPGHNPIHFLTQGLNYSFSQLALRRLTFIVDEGNISSINLCTKLGAILEATLRAASPDGDLLIFALFPENCKLWKRFDEKRRRTPAKS